MAVRIRLQRKGARHMAFYRIVAADSRSPRDGRFIDQLGYYDPLRDPPEIKIDAEKTIDWLQKGAQPSETVRALLSRVGIMETWHEFKKGRPLSELAHIEDEARKRIEAQAAMDRRKKDEKKEKKKAATEKAEEKEAQAAPAEEPETGAPAEETAEEAAPEEKVEPAGEDAPAEAADPQKDADEGEPETPKAAEQPQDGGSEGGGEKKPE